jgi:hypothetical protein
MKRLTSSFLILAFLCFFLSSCAELTADTSLPEESDTETAETTSYKKMSLSPGVDANKMKAYSTSEFKLKISTQIGNGERIVVFDGLIIQ